MVEAVIGTRARAGTTSHFYVWMAAACLAVAVLGFMPSYFVPMAQGTFRAEPIVHLHGALMFAWVLYFFAQTWLVAQGKVLAHRTWGMLGIAIMTALAFMTLAVVAMRIAQASVPGRPPGLAHDVRAFEWISVYGIVSIVPMFTLAIVYVRNPEIHKRLMLLVTLSMLGAPIARWFIFFLAAHGAAAPLPVHPGFVAVPPVFLEIPPSLVADLLLVVAIVFDWRTRGRPHPVYLIAGSFGLFMLATLVPVAESPAWQWLATGLGHLAG